MIQKYEMKPEVVEAVFYTYPASQEIKDWLGDEYQIEYKARHPGAAGAMELSDMVIFEGRWIIRQVLDKVRYHVMSPKNFDAVYRLKE